MFVCPSVRPFVCFQSYKHDIYRQACAAKRSHPVLFLLSGPNYGFFASQGRHAAPIIVKFGTGESAPQVRSSAPNFTFIGQRYGKPAPKTVKIEFCTEICPSGATRLHNFYENLSICTRLQVG